MNRHMCVAVAATFLIWSSSTFAETTINGGCLVETPVTSFGRGRLVCPFSWKTDSQSFFLDPNPTSLMVTDRSINNYFAGAIECYTMAFYKDGGVITSTSRYSCSTQGGCSSPPYEYHEYVYPIRMTIPSAFEEQASYYDFSSYVLVCTIPQDYPTNGSYVSPYRTTGFLY
jgi:hypothetical protein